MNRNFVVFALCATALVFTSCLGSDPVAEEKTENTVAMCNDGLDNDGDNDFDCYDSDCRALDSTMRLGGDTLCHYENIAVIPSSSSAEVQSSSSIVASSSSVANDSIVEGFPMTVKRSDNDTVQILYLLRKPGSTQIAVGGKLRSFGLFGVIDTTGQVLRMPDILRTDNGLLGKLGLSSWTETGRTLLGLDTSYSGKYLLFGSSDYAQGSIATTYAVNMGLDSNTTMAWPYHPASYAFVGVNASNSICIAINQSDTGYVMIDENASDASIPSYSPVTFIGGAIQAGEIVGDQCATIGNRTVSNPDSAQIWFFSLDRTNDLDTMVQVTTGSDQESASDLEVVGGKAYIAASVGGQPRMLVLAANRSLEVDGSGQGLGTGTILRIRRITVGGTTRLLLLGESGGKAALWLMGADGSKISAATFTEASGFSDVLQLGNGELLVAGWKSNAPAGTGTSGVILKLNTSLAIIAP